MNKKSLVQQHQEAVEASIMKLQREAVIQEYLLKFCDDADLSIEPKYVHLFELH